MAKPSNYPEWASLDQTDPISGSNNSLQPPPQKALYGFDRLEFPPRNWINWLYKTINEWIVYFDQQDSLNTTTDGSGTDPLIDLSLGGMLEISVVDEGATANFYTGIVYVPPGYSSGTLAFNEIASATLTVSNLSVTGSVTVSGGTGPYILSSKVSR